MEQTYGRKRVFGAHGAAPVLNLDTRGAFRTTSGVVRNLERSGVGRSVAMELVGHKTESVCRRYDIVAERDLTDGVARYATRLQEQRR
jgi:hypothetical protein